MVAVPIDDVVVLAAELATVLSVEIESVSAIEGARLPPTEVVDLEAVEAAGVSLLVSSSALSGTMKEPVDFLVVMVEVLRAAMLIRRNESGDFLFGTFLAGMGGVFRAVVVICGSGSSSDSSSSSSSLSSSSLSSSGVEIARVLRVDVRAGTDRDRAGRAAVAFDAFKLERRDDSSA